MAPSSAEGGQKSEEVQAMPNEAAMEKINKRADAIAKVIVKRIMRSLTGKAIFQSDSKSRSDC
jgi:hypothetical protein